MGKSRDLLKKPFAAVLLLAIAGCDAPFDAGGVYHGRWVGRIRQEYDFTGGMMVDCPLTLVLKHDCYAIWPFNRRLTGALSFDWACFAPPLLGYLTEYGALEVPVGGFMNGNGELVLGAGGCPAEFFCVTLGLEAAGQDFGRNGLMDSCYGEFRAVLQLFNMTPLEIEGQFELNRAWGG